MELRVALASSDGITVDQHFGRATRFCIYRLTGAGWEHLEDRYNTPACAGQEHADGMLEQTAEVISDCRGLAVARIGASAIDVLLARRIFPLVLELPVPEALATLEKSKLLSRYINQ
ncbi:NifB/NifX family molybdenum-iron cluster-binding protein [Geomonas anaerohicana]|uniref:Dinitrogenase iron-molybdenum cofactor biosynthesis domain-containing protein n=1 Tax=Geomonas anaerohicana TaxID=2798583 RepID=A0ABS0YBG8_9BACT|nr:NifB/NifX family molybdenum-iron cluster-binding protein [Geomonas anaerohicana]MBJ6749489.1 hypothetical protein [Geomonas anaerohicana]